MKSTKENNNKLEIEAFFQTAISSAQKHASRMKSHT
jgi:hypothetical protein